MGRRITSGVRRWGAVLVGFVGLNGALLLGQGLLKRDDQARAEATQAQIASMDQELADLAVLIETHESEGTAIDAMALRLQDPATWYPSRTDHERAQREHNRRVDSWNLEMPRVSAAAARHNDLVEKYNQAVAEYNVLIETAYARWWLLPIPAPSRAGHSSTPR
jgi:hypothetical protein